MSEELVAIGEVAERFGLTVSTLRYWDERGLVRPVARRSGRRYYSTEQVHRIGLVQMWQEAALMSLDEIAAMLAGASGDQDWRAIVRSRIEAVDRQLAALQEGRAHLVHLLTCPQDRPADHCPELRAASLARQQVHHAQGPGESVAR